MNTYSIAQGDTLSGLAEKNGISVNDILSANKDNKAAVPDVNNPNLILAGGSLNLPQKGSVLQSTTSQRTQTNQNAADLTALNTRTAANAAATTAANAAAATGTQDGKTVQDPKAINPGDSLTGQPAGAVGFQYDATGEKQWVDAEGKPLASSNDPLTAIKGRIADIRTSGNTQITAMKNTLQGLINSTDSTTAARIQSLISQYQQRIDDTHESFQRLGAAKNTADFRNGVNRYTAEQGQGILTDVEVREQTAITNLITKMNDAVTKAQQARDGNDTKNFNLMYTKVKDYQKQINDSITSLEKESAKQETDKIKAAQQSEKDHRTGIKDDMERSKRMAPALSDSIKGLNATQKKAAIEKYAKENDLDPGILTSDIQAYSDKGAKAVAAKKGASGSTGNPYVSGGLSYTNDDLGHVGNVLTTGATIDGKAYPGMAETGYADPALYKAMADKWRKAGGLIDDFVKKFPPEKYVDPSITTLPTYLSPKKKSSSSSVSDVVNSIK